MGARGIATVTYHWRLSIRSMLLITGLLLCTVTYHWRLSIRSLLKARFPARGHGNLSLAVVNPQPGQRMAATQITVTYHWRLSIRSKRNGMACRQKTVTYHWRLSIRSKRKLWRPDLRHGNLSLAVVNPQLRGSGLSLAADGNLSLAVVNPQPR